MPIKTLIMGAAGRDFHNFNTFFRGNKDYEVVAFTATQIPDIEGRVYPRELAGDLYPGGIPIRAEDELVDLIKQHGVEQVIFAYSDVPHEYIMHKASIVNAAGVKQDYWLYTVFNCAPPPQVHAICSPVHLPWEPMQQVIQYRVSAGAVLDEAAQIKNTQIAEELALPPVKIHCSVLAEDAIKAAISDYQAKQGKDQAKSA